MHEADLLEEIVIYQVDDKKVSKTAINKIYFFKKGWMFLAIFKLY